MQYPGPVPYHQPPSLGPSAPASGGGFFTKALGQDFAGGVASGLLAEAQRTGSGAGFAAGFAGAAAPTLEARRDRLDAASAERQYDAMVEAFTQVPREVQDLLDSIDQWGQHGAQP